jgi:serine O-acetyltransferase
MQCICAGPLAGAARRLAFGRCLPDSPAVQKTLTDLTERLLASYRQKGGINHLDGKNLPSRHAIALIVQDVLRLLCPGFFSDRVIHSSEVALETATLMDLVAGRLEQEVLKSLDYAPPAGTDRGNLAELARKIALEFLEELPAVRDLLSTDVEAAYQGDPAALSQDEVIVAYPCIEAIAVQRISHVLYRKEVALIPRIMTEWAHGRTGMDLHPGAQIGSHFFIDHGTGTVIGETAIIGDRVKLYQGVGLVARSLSAGQALRGQKRHPTLGDRVTVYAGATIMGGDTVVGAGSTIGASVFLPHSVPPNSLVVNEDVRVKVMAKRRSSAPLDFQI